MVVSTTSQQKDIDWNDDNEDDNDGLLHVGRRQTGTKDYYDAQRISDSVMNNNDRHNRHGDAHHLFSHGSGQISLHDDNTSFPRGGDALPPNNDNDNISIGNDDDDDDILSKNAGVGGTIIRSRRAIVEIPMRVVRRRNTSLYTEPNSRMSMQKTFPIWQQQRKASSSQPPSLAVVMLGQLSSTFTMRGKTGYSQGDAHVTCRIQPRATSARPAANGSKKLTFGGSSSSPPVLLLCNAGISTTAGNPKIVLSTGATILHSSADSAGSVVGGTTTTAMSAKYSTTVGVKGVVNKPCMNLSVIRQFSSCILQSNCILHPSSSSSSSSPQGDGNIVFISLFNTSLTLRTVQPWTVSLGWNPRLLLARQGRQQQGDAASSSSSSSPPSLLYSSMVSSSKSRNWFLSFSTIPTIVLSPLLRLCLSLGCSTNGAWNVCAIWKQSLPLVKQQQELKYDGTTSTNNNNKDTTSNSHPTNQRQLSIGVEKHVVSSSSSSSSWASNNNNMTSNAAASTGLVWLFTWTDNDLTVHVPVSLCPTFLNHTSSLSSCTQLVLQGLLVSVLSAWMQQVVAQLVMSVYSADDKSDNTRLRNNASTTTTSAMSRRKDALQQQNLMKRQASTRMRAEEEKSGLVIETAIYRLVTATTSTTPNDRTADSSNPQQQQQNNNEDIASFLNVTVPLQFWVSESSLELPAMSKKNLLGFHELSTATMFSSSATSADKDEEARHGINVVTSLPALSSSSSSASLLLSACKSFTHWFSGFYTLRQIKNKNNGTLQQRPILYVRYKFEGMVYEITVQDTESLKLPSLRATKVSSSSSSSGGDE